MGVVAPTSAMAIAIVKYNRQHKLAITNVTEHRSVCA
jgi:hypothetical protein